MFYFHIYNFTHLFLSVRCSGKKYFVKVQGVVSLFFFIFDISQYNIKPWLCIVPTWHFEYEYIILAGGGQGGHFKTKWNDSY